MWRKIEEIVDREEDDNTKIYVTGFRSSTRTFCCSCLDDVGPVRVSIATMIAILWFEFRSWQGVSDPGTVGSALGDLGPWLRRPVRVVARPARAGGPAPALGTRALAFGPIDGALSRGVRAPRRPRPGDRQVLHVPLCAGDGIATRRWAGGPYALRRAHPVRSRSSPCSRASGSCRSSSAS